MTEKDKEGAETVVLEEELPKTIVRRVVKEKLSQLSTDSEITVRGESYLAFSESARIFIHYLSATANDVCKESKRQIINAEDVFKALEEIEFQEFIKPLRSALEEFRQKNAEKRSGSSKAKDSDKVGKMKESPAKSEGQSKDSDKKGKRKESSAKSEGQSKDSDKKGKRKESSAKSEGQSKDSDKKGKRKESSAKNEGRKKQREDKNEAD